MPGISHEAVRNRGQFILDFTISKKVHIRCAVFIPHSVVAFSNTALNV